MGNSNLEDGKLIDDLFEELYKKAQNPKYELLKYAVPWGSKYEERYSNLKVSFTRTIRNFAKECGIMALGEDFYVFTGRVYEKISPFIVAQAYDRLLESFGIAEMMSNVRTRKEVFMGTILAYNQLHVRNDVVAFSNGVVTFDNGKLTGVRQKFGPAFHVTEYHPYPYNPDVKPIRWLQFLKEVLPDKSQRDILQMFLGLGLVQTSEAFGKKKFGTPRGTVELCLLLLGSGANGKSVLFNVICALFGKGHITSLDYDTLTADGDEGLRGRYPIRSAIFNWSSDSDPRRFGKKNTAMFKRIVSGEPVPYRELRHNIEMTETCPYLIFSLNELPAPADNTRGFMRRLQYVNFDVTIPKHRQNPSLAADIIALELPGVFNWVVRGAREIRRRKFVFPDSETSMKQKIRMIIDVDPVKAWMLAYGIRAEAYTPGELYSRVKTPEMYKSFTAFVEDNNLLLKEEYNERKFAFRLTKNGLTRVHRVDGTYVAMYGCLPETLKEHIYLENLQDPPTIEDDKESYIKED